MDLKTSVLGVVGLGYVGLPLAVEFGTKRKVIGFDVNEERVAQLKSGYDRTKEVTKDELNAAKYLTITNAPTDLGAANIFIVTVPTPIDGSKLPDLTPLKIATETVGKLLKPGNVVIYESTVFPGATEEVCVPILERASGLEFNKDFFAAYSPERINPGDKTHRLTQIKKVTSGSNPFVAKVVDDLYREIILAGTHSASSIKVAEAAKVIENAQRDLNIAFVNELSLIFNRAGIDTSEVLAAAQTKWNFLPFTPGLVGGHCIGVDPYYLTHKAQQLGYQPEVILSGRRVNDNMGSYVARKVVQLMINNGIDVSRASVGVLGVTFKENCPDVRNSKVIDIVRELKEWGISVQISDPLADPRDVLDEYGLHVSNGAFDSKVDSLIVAVAHAEYKGSTPEQLRRLCGGQDMPVLADLKVLFDKKELESHGFTVFRL